MKKKYSGLFVALVVVSVIALVTADILAAKSFSLFGWSVQGNKLIMPTAFIVFPITYILSDVFSECYGYKASRRVCWLSFGAFASMIIVISLGVLIPPANPYFAMISDSLKEAFGLQFLDGKNFGSLGVLIASLSAFVVGDLVNDLIFEKLKQKDKERNSMGKFILRAVSSSFFGELIDSTIFFPLLYLFTKQYGTFIFSFWQVVAVIVINASIKTLYEFVISPLTALIAKKVKAYENSFEN